MRNPNSVHTEWQRTLKMKSKSIDHEVPDPLFRYCNYAASANRFSEISRTCMDYGLNRFTLTFTKIDIPVSHLIYLICRTRVRTITPSLSNNSCMNYGRSPWKFDIGIVPKEWLFINYAGFLSKRFDSKFTSTW